MSSFEPNPPTKLSVRAPVAALSIVAIFLSPINLVVGLAALQHESNGIVVNLFHFLAALQVLLGILAAGYGIERKSQEAFGFFPVVLGTLASISAAGGWLLEMAMLSGGLTGGAWGRPLRIRGRQLHPELKEGADWTEGERPDGTLLGDRERRALEALWLHDAQKEHASVPAFSRISWLLAAVGAPAELSLWAHRAALEEIDHTRRCFALAAGYGGRTHSVEAMPDLLIGALETTQDPLVTLTEESVGDGCQLEDFNADVAAECARVCEEPATRKVLEQIAREERSHAEFSWALLEWLLERDPQKVRRAIEKSLHNLEKYPRPTAVSTDKLALVAHADEAVLRRHGRLPDARWGALWELRRLETRKRINELLSGSKDGRLPLTESTSTSPAAP